MLDRLQTLNPRLAALALVGSLISSGCADDTTEANVAFSTSGTDANSNTNTGTTDSSAMTDTGVASTGEASESTTTSGEADTDTDTTTGNNPNCGDERKIFITSEKFTGGFDGLSGADMLCNKILAGSENSDVMEPGTFFAQAWLADESGSPQSRLDDFCGQYVDFNGNVIAENHSDLLGLRLVNSIVLDENGKEVGGSIWSNVAEGGVAAFNPSGYHCNNWTSNSIDERGFTGEIGAEGDQWTSDTIEQCNSIRHLICIVGESIEN